MATTFIYSLNCPVTGEPRYIGKTNNLESRLKYHLKEKNHSHKTNWIKFLKKNNLEPNIEEIDIIPNDNWQFWEKHYISLYKSWGFKLVNGTNGGDGRTRGFKASQETLQKMREVSIRNGNRPPNNSGKKMKYKISKEYLSYIRSKHSKGRIQSQEEREFRKTKAKFAIKKEFEIPVINDFKINKLTISEISRKYGFVRSTICNMLKRNRIHPFKRKITI